MKENLGKYGGKVKRLIKNAGGKQWLPGAILKPSDVEKWPMQNREAMEADNLVEWFPRPAETAMDVLDEENASASSPDENSSESEDVGDDEEEEPDEEPDEEEDDDSEEESEEEEADEGAGDEPAEEPAPAPEKPKSSRRKSIPKGKATGKGKKGKKG